MGRKFFVGGNWKCVSLVFILIYSVSDIEIWFRSGFFFFLSNQISYLNWWFNFFWMQTGTTEEVKKIVSTLNDAQVPSSDVVGKCVFLTLAFFCSIQVLLLIWLHNWKVITQIGFTKITRNWWFLIMICL